MILKQKYYTFKTPEKMFLLIYKIDNHNRIFENKKVLIIYTSIQKHTTTCVVILHTPLRFILSESSPNALINDIGSYLL